MMPTATTNDTEAAVDERSSTDPPFYRDPLALIGILLFLALAFRFFNYCEDDVFIPMRYALNFRHGHGWVMNPGERVDGCTSPLGLWVDTLLLRFLSPDQTLFTLKIMGCILGIGVLAQARSLGRLLLPENPALWRALPVLIAFQPAFALSMINGLETSIAAFLLAAGLLQLTREIRRDNASHLRPAGWFTLAALARPELALTFPAVLAILAARRRQLDWRSTAVYFLPLIALCAFRIPYYGNWLPNTYYAKNLPLSLGLRLGVDYIREFAFPGMPVVWGALIVAGAVRLARRIDAAPIVLTLALQTLFLLRSGGDWMMDGRFCAVVAPASGVALVSGLFALRSAAAGMAKRYSPLLAKTLAIGVAAVFVLTALVDAGRTLNVLLNMRSLRGLDYVVSPHAPFERWMGSTADGRLAMARWIGRHARPGQTVLAGEVGIVPIDNMTVDFIDVCGLTDSTIAHMTGYPRGRGGLGGGKMWMRPDGELPRYIHRRRPEWVALLWGTDKTKLQGATDSDDLYIPVEIFPIRLDGYIQYIATWRRRDIPSPIVGWASRPSVHPKG